MLYLPNYFFILIYKKYNMFIINHLNRYLYNLMEAYNLMMIIKFFISNSLNYIYRQNLSNNLLNIFQN